MRRSLRLFLEALVLGDAGPCDAAHAHRELFSELAAEPVEPDPPRPPPEDPELNTLERERPREAQLLGEEDRKLQQVETLHTHRRWELLEEFRAAQDEWDRTTREITRLRALRQPLLLPVLGLCIAAAVEVSALLPVGAWAAAASLVGLFSEPLGVIAEVLAYVVGAMGVGALTAGVALHGLPARGDHE